MQHSDNNIINTAIESAFESPDGLAIGFANGWWLNIKNAYSYNAGPTESLVGKIILYINESSDDINYILSDGTIITVDVTDEAFSGPEAVVMIGPSGNIVVFP